MSYIDYRLMLAPSGARRKTSQVLGLPVTVERILADTKACVELGATSLHLHVRNKDESHSLDAGLYREAIEAVEADLPGLPIQITTESAEIFGPAEQLRCLKSVRPKASSVAVREMAQDPAIASQFYGFAKEANIELQHILFTPDCAEQLIAWRTDGTISDDQNRVIFVLGSYAPPRNAAPSELVARLSQIRGLGLDWSVCAFGPAEPLCLIEAFKRGGGMRIGFENNVERPDGQLFESNAASVSALGQLMSDQGLSLD